MGRGGFEPPTTRAPGEHPSPSWTTAPNFLIILFYSYEIKGFWYQLVRGPGFEPGNPYGTGS